MVGLGFGSGFYRHVFSFSEVDCTKWQKPIALQETLLHLKGSVLQKKLTTTLTMAVHGRFRSDSRSHESRKVPKAEFDGYSAE